MKMIFDIIICAYYMYMWICTAKLRVYKADVLDTNISNFFLIIVVYWLYYFILYMILCIYIVKNI